jgi:sulfatase maturation enzyme AslB (radical SAM superfamily)
MSLETAKKAVDWIFDNIPGYSNGVEIGLIGGEPLLEVELIKDLFAYTRSKPNAGNYVFFATTNGTLLTDEDKEWFSSNKDYIILGLSIDGVRETHNRNRCDSFDKIDFDFFLRNWRNQNVKMTLSEHSIKNLAQNIKFIHSLGFTKIGGVNLYEGNIDWNNDEYIRILIPQLKELVEFYTENDALALDQMFDKQIGICEVKDGKKKGWCGIGTDTPFFDVDGRRFPCSFVTPMTFSEAELNEIMKTDFADKELFVDGDCFGNCYIYPICPTCAGANYLCNRTFKKRNKNQCRVQKLISVFIADLTARRIIRNPEIYDDYQRYHTIEAIKKIRELYLPEFAFFMNL